MSKVIPLCIIACHGGPADHFATFVENLSKFVSPIEIHASGPALKKFQERHIDVQHPFSLDDLANEDALAKAIAEKCAHAKIVLTDVGHSFDAKILKALKDKEALEGKGPLRLAYYDNPESYVPGGYSETAEKVMQNADKILFANSHLAKDPMRHIGLGYYPSANATNIKKRRETEKSIIRKEFFETHSLKDTGQKIWVYFGGNNTEYFEKAFPAFLRIMKEADLNEVILLLQQHPGAQKSNEDASQISDQPVVISRISSADAQVLADLALYYQTSMAAQFALAGIPTAQIGHKPYDDILVKNKLCPSITSAQDLPRLPNEPMVSDSLANGLGIREDWLEILKNVLK